MGILSQKYQKLMGKSEIKLNRELRVPQINSNIQICLHFMDLSDTTDISDENIQYSVVFLVMFYSNEKN